MHYRKLGNSTLEVSEIAFGCMSLGSGQTDADLLVGTAIDGGINLFDTADMYEHGGNEVIVGKAIKPYRKGVLIATKVGNQWNAGKAAWEWNAGKHYITSQVEASLQRLQTDYIDLYQLHGGMIQDPIDETIEAFNLLVQQGKIRYYGISSIRPNVIREYVSRSAIISVMMQYSLLDRRPEESCLPLLEEAGIGVLVRGSIAKGLLGGKPADNFLQYGKLDVHKAAMAIKSISSDQRNQMQTAVQYVLQQRAVTSAVVGIRTKEQLDDALAVTNTLRLTATEMNYLNQVLHPNFYEEHR